MAFAFDPQPIADARTAEHEHFAPPSLDGLSDVAFAYPENPLRVIADADLRRTYTDGLLDLHHLIDDYRFEALLALTILRDYVIKRDRGEAPVVTLGSETSLSNTLPFPAETVLVMRRHAIEPPIAAELFENPHQQIAGGRMLSRWFAAQLIDSALYRGIAACDRLAILLRCQAGLPVVVTKAGERRQPAFTRGAMKDLDEHFGAIPDWPDLKDLADNAFSSSSNRSATASPTSAGGHPNSTARLPSSTGPRTTGPRR